MPESSGEPVRPLVLASASPRRADLLRAAGIAFEVVVGEVDERARDGEAPHKYVARLAADKARVVAGRQPGRVVLAADTTVVVDETMLGKPADAADARRMLERLAGRTHRVLTGVAVLAPGLPAPVTAVEITSVELAPMTAAEIDWYVASGEPFDKAGAYAIQGLASRFVTRIDGSYANVVGLPVALVYRLVGAVGRVAGWPG